MEGTINFAVSSHGTQFLFILVAHIHYLWSHIEKSGKYQKTKFTKLFVLEVVNTIILVFRKT